MYDLDQALAAITAAWDTEQLAYQRDGYAEGLAARLVAQQSPAWEPSFSSWRHGGWYVDNLAYPSGAVGCVSRNFADGKWRIVCDSRPFETAPTFRNRREAALGERNLIAAVIEERS